MCVYSVALSILKVARISFTFPYFKSISSQIIFACLLAFAIAAPEKDAQILRDDRVYPEGAAYSFDFETENGIKYSEGGAPEGEAQAIVSSGQME